MLWILPYILTCLTIELTPGPNMGYLAILATRSGRGAGFAAIIGIALGLLLLGLLAAVGVAEMIGDSLLFSQLLSFVGFFYLLWLAREIWCGENDASPGALAERSHRWRYFRQGLVTNLLNPKALMFYVAVLPGFAGAPPHSLARIIILTLISVAVATMVHVGVVLLAGQGKAFFTQPQRQRRMQHIMAGLMVGIAVWFLAASIR